MNKHKVAYFCKNFPIKLKFGLLVKLIIRVIRLPSLACFDTLCITYHHCIL